MSRFNARTAKLSGASPIVGEVAPSTVTHEGGAGYARSAKSELFLLAVANMVGTDTFYETGGKRDDRYTRLVRKLAIEDPEWCVNFLRWLRGPGNMRTAALVGAAEFTAERILQQAHGHSRQAVNAVLQRADEPGELIAYWEQKYGRLRDDGNYDVQLPLPVKRGIADAVKRLYSERSLLKYDTAVAKRFGDVLELVHASPAADQPWQGDLFKHAIDRRHGREQIPSRLRTLRERAALVAVPVDERRAELTGPDGAAWLERAGMTWEAVAGWLQGPMDAPAWEAVIPSMGVMALARNLRNFDEAGVSDEVAETVARKIADPEQVAKSRMLPMRFYSAYNAAPSLRWGHALERALTASLANIPQLPGRTLILVDTSSSMHAGFSKDGTLMRWDAAALFGIALGQRCASADVVSFSSAQYYVNDPRGAKTKPFPLTRGGSLLGDVRKWKDGGWFLGGGTDTAGALRKEFNGHERVVIVTDEQASYSTTDVSSSIPEAVPMYTWNLAGYEAGHAPSGSRNRHTFGGLTDQAFGMIPLLEAGCDAKWPWL